MYHNPVMLTESLNALMWNPSGIYVDLTFGGGGHSKSIMQRLSGGKLIAFDHDADAAKNALDDEGFTLVKQNFRYLKNNLRLLKAIPVSGVLADLGVSSHQFDQPERGFSFRYDEKLDMRMNQSLQITAEEVINHYSEEHLSKLFYEYGEVSFARKLAWKIVSERMNRAIQTTFQLAAIVEQCCPKHVLKKELTKVFQALRIEVNQEMQALKEMLMQLPDVVEKNGRIVIISYHSLEDRMVKNFIKTGNVEGELKKDFFGRIEKPFHALGKVESPSDTEITENPRARSAKMRVAERL